LEINNHDTLNHEKKKKLCAVKNPSERSNQSWFYNIFLGNITNNKQKRNRIKVNWVMELNEDEIRLLKEKSCVIIEIENNINNKPKDVETNL